MSFLALTMASLIGTASAGEQKDIILVVWDATRADHLTPYGYERDTTPNLAALAQTATVFDNAQASGSWTIPSVASLFTGLFSHNHKVDYAPTKGIVDIPAETTTLAETLHDQGWFTALFTAQSVFYQPGYQQGFDMHELTGSGTFKDKVTQALDKAGDKPVFMVLYWLNPHSPYTPPKLHDIFSDPDGPQVDIVLKAEDARKPGDHPHDDVNAGRVTLTEAEWAQLEARYDGELHSNDQRMQNCLDRYARRRSLEDAVFVMTSDHGEMFNDRPQQRTWHGWPTHENQHVPLIVKAPGQKSGARVATQVRGVDVYPTVLELAGARLDHAINGESLVPLLQGDAGRDRANVGATHYWDGLQFYNDGDHNLIMSRNNASRVFLYDLERDPDEQTNLAETDPGLVERVKGRMLKFIEQTTIELGIQDGSSLSKEDEERLRALGYME